MDRHHQLVGVGIGPFNLSLAALLDKIPSFKSVFFEKKPQFEWHPEFMFQDSVMQTSYLKDLVTPVDPTSQYSFLNYLVQKQLFYPFLNTRRSAISRKEFEQYCAWVAEKLGSRLRFGTEVRSVHHEGQVFRIETSDGTYTSDHLCVATGLTPRIPECALKHLGPRVFHAKSPALNQINLADKSVMIVGGGQTGIEVFRNAIQGLWGRAREIQLVTRRKGLEPLDESAFTNEYFTPSYVDRFWSLDGAKKARVVADQKLASDGNTPAYLTDLYNDLYRLKHVEKDPRTIRILACRKLHRMEKDGESHRLTVANDFLGSDETFRADVVILCTGFESVVPPMLEPLFPRIPLDEEKRFRFRKSYSIEWDGPAENRIYALNFSRHQHGIIDPQMSLMAWRSAVVVNDVTGAPHYPTDQISPNFVEFGSVGVSEIR